MYFRIAAALIVAVFLAGTHWKAYTKGQDAITAEWDKDVAQRTAAALEASEKARKTEQELSAKVGRIDRAYQDQKRATATVVSAVAVGMRELETALATAPSASASDAATASGNHGTGGIERELLGSCAAALAQLGQEADRLSLKVVTLQAYIREMKP
jgi:hypothetical protein